MSVFGGGAPVHPVSRVIVAQRLLIIYGITAGTKGNPSFAAFNSNRRYQKMSIVFTATFCASYRERSDVAVYSYASCTK